VSEGAGDVRIAIGPRTDERFESAVRRGGGVPITKIADARGLIWTDPRDPKALGKALRRSNAAWVQLPFAGIEGFFAEGVIDPGRAWTCAKGIYGPATAEHALTLMLAGARRLHEHARSDMWRPAGFATPERRLGGSTALVVGTGGIGRALIAMLRPLGVRVLAVNRSGVPVVGADVSEPLAGLPHLIADADFVVLACALTHETRGLFDSVMLDYMKEDAWLVNVARGGLVVTDDLVDALRNRSIGGAALDVTDPEPLPDGHPLWSLPDALITPHVANTWDMALPELTALVERNVRAFVAGEPLEGTVDPKLGY
jgi:phosphoglycerate dehydrogenase-like enzyme